MEYCKLTWDDIDGIAIGYDPLLWQDRLQLEMNAILDRRKNSEPDKNDCRHSAREIMDKIISSNLVNRYSFFKDVNNVKKLVKDKLEIDRDIPISFYEHHLAHIASSYEVSGFQDAVGIVVDGIGETATTTIWKIQNHKYEKLLQLDYPNSLGYYYAVMTKYLGFTPWCHEGKTMALAAYGQEEISLQEKMHQIIDVSKDIYDVASFIEENAAEFLMIDEAKAIKSLEEILGVPARKSEDDLTDIHQNIAWSVQNTLEKAVVNLVNYGIKMTGIKNVCVAGGIFMNCKMNMIVRENSLAEHYFVQPLAGDLGLCIGSGLLMSTHMFANEYKNIYFGPDFSNEEILEVLERRGAKFEKCEDISYRVAELIAKGKIVCWFEGRMEMGARALGGRSILADPTRSYMSDKINMIVKHREVWRPFACSVLEEFCDSIFENYEAGNSYPFMIEAFKVKEEWIGRIPAVIHRADNTSRPQSVSKGQNPLYHRMISYFYELTGCPLVLNTSFNDKGQPIIMSPDMAVDFFDKIQVDALAVGDFIIERD